MGEYCRMKNKGVYRYGRRISVVRLRRMVDRMRRRPPRSYPYALFESYPYVLFGSSETVTLQLGDGEIGKIERFRFVY